MFLSGIGGVDKGEGAFVGESGKDQYKTRNGGMEVVI